MARAVDDRSCSAEIYFESIVETIREPLVILDGRLRVVSANGAFYRLFRVTPGETEHRPVYEIGSGQWSMDGLRHLLEKVIPSNEQFKDYEVDHDFPVIGHRVMLLSGRKIEQGEGREQLILLTIEDSTERKEKDAALAATIRLVENSPDIITRFDLEGRHVYANKSLEEHVGKSKKEIQGKKPVEIGIPPPTAAIFDAAFRRVLETGEAVVTEVSFGPSINHAVIVPEKDREGNIISFAGYSRDITELKKAESRLRESEEKYRTLVEKANDGIIIVQDGVIVYANPRMAALDGSTVEELVGTRYTDHVYPSEIPRMVELYRRRMSGEKLPPSYETVLIRHNREAAPAEVSIAVITYRGKPADLVIIHDITEFKLTEKGLRRKEAEFRTLAENSPDVIVRYDRDGRFLYANPRAEPIFGHPPAQIIGKKLSEIGLPEQGAAFWESLAQEVFDTRKGKKVEFEYPSGEKYYSSYVVPEIDERGNVVSVLSISRDITDMKKTEETLRRNEYELRSLSDNSPDLIVRMDSRLRYQYVNSSFERLTGLQKERVIGRTNDELGMLPQLAESWQRALKRVVETGREYSMEFETTSLFGKRYFATRLIPEFIKTGQVETVLVIARDITERVQAEEQVRYISFHDAVTGLFNRSFFEEELRRIDGERNLPVSIIMGDVNNLKLSNDVFGHEEGDRLLKAIADLLRQACRQDDIIARWGGDEFAVILPRTGFDDAREVCERVKRMSSENKGTVIEPSIALGTATKVKGEQNIHQTVRQAEENMYENKIAESGQNTEKVLSSLLARARERSQDLTSHIDRDYALANLFAEALNLPEDLRKSLRLLIELHDIGMAVLPREILTKPGRLTAEERAVVEKHSEAGFRIAKTFPDTAGIADDILAHGEHWDGAGYPRGLKGREIPYLARIFAVVEAYDVMTHPRHYARTLSRDEAVGELLRNAGRQFDPELVEVFIGKVLKDGKVKV